MLHARLLCITVLLAFAIGIVSMAGCSNLNRGEEQAVQAVRDPLIQDIPKPAGFQLVDDRSVARVSGQVRVARCEYEGRTDRQAVKRFYETNLPQAGFELKKTSLDDGVWGLTFESATEVADLRIRKKGFRTVVVIELGPKPVGTTEREPAAGAPPRRNTGG
ncbi:MAG: hypothetical protein ACKVS9_05435 [Phycisphaerae bacterium]